MRQDVYVWRDGMDKNQFWFGTKNKSPRQEYSGWAAIFCDGFADMFGADAWEQLKDLKPQEPVRVRLTIEVMK